MTYDRARDLSTDNARSAGAARDWYALTNAMIGAQELPTYGRGLRVRMGSGASVPLTIVCVPVGEETDGNTRSLIVDATENLPLAVRRIVSLNAGATLPSGVSIDIITK